MCNVPGSNAMQQSQQHICGMQAAGTGGEVLKIEFGISMMAE
jgi:hypothetical protein